MFPILLSIEQFFPNALTLSSLYILPTTRYKQSFVFMGSISKDPSNCSFNQLQIEKYSGGEIPKVPKGKP